MVQNFQKIFTILKISSDISEHFLCLHVYPKMCRKYFNLCFRIREKVVGSSASSLARQPARWLVGHVVGSLASSSAFLPSTSRSLIATDFEVVGKWAAQLVGRHPELANDLLLRPNDEYFGTHVPRVATQRPN